MEDQVNNTWYNKKLFNTAILVISLLFTVLLILKAFKVLLLILASVLIAIFFRGIAKKMATKISLSEKWCLITTITLFFVVFCLVGIGLFPRVSSQVGELQEQLPQAFESTKNQLNQNDIGKWIVSQINKVPEKLGSGGDQISSFFSSFLGGVADLYIIFFLSLFFLAQPYVYIKGILRFFPKAKRAKVQEVIDSIGYTLSRWLLGKVFSMLIVGLLTGIGLLILDIPLALSLALFATLITFIPNFGPILSLIPAFLLAFTQSPTSAIYVVGLYAAIQAIESNIITPLIQKEMISFPFALILIAQVILGVFTGVLGVILAVPLVAIIGVLVNKLYLEKLEALEVS